MGLLVRAQWQTACLSSRPESPGRQLGRRRCGIGRAFDGPSVLRTEPLLRSARPGAGLGRIRYSAISNRVPAAAATGVNRVIPTLIVNKLSVIHKKSDGVSTGTPDTCLTPAPPGPPVPVPYVN